MTRFTFFLLLAHAATALHAATPDGATLYHDYCSVCHGDQGDGKSRAMGGMEPPPRDFSLPSSAIGLSRERMISSVTHGRPGTAMAAWDNQLDAAQIEAVVDYIRTTFMPPTTLPDDDEGRRLYADYCSVCHGDRGDGRSRASDSFNPPPRDFTRTDTASELSLERMLFSVRHGRANTAMAAWGEQLDERQIAAVVDYVRSAFMRLDANSAQVTARTHAPASTGHVHGDGEADMGARFPDGLVGDVNSGEALYLANCATCHGDTGDGRGPRAYFINPKPRDFGHSAARASLNRPHLYAAIAEGRRATEMPAWRHVLTPQEMANVAEYVFTAFITLEDPPRTRPSAAQASDASHDHAAPGHAH